LFEIEFGFGAGLRKEVTSYDAMDRWVELAASIPGSHSGRGAAGVW
jgi:hypothetical protein